MSMISSIRNAEPFNVRKSFHSGDCFFRAHAKVDCEYNLKQVSDIILSKIEGDQILILIIIMEHYFSKIHLSDSFSIFK